MCELLETINNIRQAGSAARYPIDLRVALFDKYPSLTINKIHVLTGIGGNTLHKWKNEIKSGAYHGGNIIAIKQNKPSVPRDTVKTKRERLVDDINRATARLAEFDKLLEQLKNI